MVGENWRCPVRQASLYAYRCKGFLTPLMKRIFPVSVALKCTSKLLGYAVKLVGVLHAISWPALHSDIMLIG